jgi:hypothetical protein
MSSSKAPHFANGRNNLLELGAHYNGNRQIQGVSLLEKEFGKFTKPTQRDDAYKKPCVATHP